ncbi:MAG: flagellar hook-length control protein FliK [Treponema sp.]|nr:flagellar hook-length control protein FliK [Treponema sp.]
MQVAPPVLSVVDIKSVAPEFATVQHSSPTSSESFSALVRQERHKTADPTERKHDDVRTSSLSEASKSPAARPQPEGQPQKDARLETDASVAAQGIDAGESTAVSTIPEDTDREKDILVAVPPAASITDFSRGSAVGEMVFLDDDATSFHEEAEATVSDDELFSAMLSVHMEAGAEILPAAHPDVSNEWEVERASAVSVMDGSVSPAAFHLFDPPSAVSAEQMAFSDLQQESTFAGSEEQEPHELAAPEDRVRNLPLDAAGKITVTDFRSRVDAHSAPSIQADVAAGDGGHHVQMTIDMAQAFAQQHILSAHAPVAGAPGADFQAMFANQIVQHAPEFVKAGAVVLRDNNTGTIDLSLNPRELGTVKVHLQISDNVITGRILVDSRNAFAAFRESAENLRQAFVESGFDMQELTVAWAGQHAAGGFTGEHAEHSQQFAASYAYGEYAAEPELLAAVGTEYSGYDEYAVNVTA